MHLDFGIHIKKKYNHVVDLRFGDFMVFYLLQEKTDLQDRKERKQVTTQNHLEVKKRMEFCDKNLNFSVSRLLSSGLRVKRMH